MSYEACAPCVFARQADLASSFLLLRSGRTVAMISIGIYSRDFGTEEEKRNEL